MITVTTIPVRRTGILHQGWRGLAACKDAAPDLFFPEQGDKGTEAKQICARCPVARECLEHALTQPEKYGVWAGKAERERYGKASRARLDTGAVPDDWKRCSGCKTPKPRDTFAANRSKPDGLESRCKECARAADRRRYWRIRNQNLKEVAAA